MKKTIVRYGIMDASLKDVLQIVHEIVSISGMEPEEIVMDDDVKVRFHQKDFEMLQKGGISEEEYIRWNLIYE